VTGQIYAIRWSNPYTEPPEGQPRELARMVVPRGERPVELLAQLDVLGLGSGWGLHFFGNTDDKPPRRLPPSSRASIRRKRLEARMRRNNPLFADAAIEAALAANPAYYFEGL
jgi:hypothetical protein